MAELRTLVSDLAKLGDGPPVITLYLDTKWRDEQQRSRVRLFFRERAREARQLFAETDERARGISATLDRLEQWVELAVNQDIFPDAGGVMLVASEPRGLFEEVIVGEPFDLAMYIDTRPRLFPLIRQMSLDRPAFLVSIDSKGAQLTEWRRGTVVDETDVERDIMKRHKMGGWSQRHYQRHVRRLIEGVWKECAELLERRVLDEPQADVILFGQEMNLRGFEKCLPEAIVQRIIGMRPLQPDRLKMLDIAREVIEDERVAREFAMVHRILRQGLSDRSGTVGLEETLVASNERRIRVLALSRRFDVMGFHCLNCDALWHTGATGCVFCNGRTETKGLREELSRRCVAEGGDVVVAPDGGPLDAYRGIGALLRHLTGAERAQPIRGAVGRVEPTLSA
jgi:peptide chain release factor subunit 1